MMLKKIKDFAEKMALKIINSMGSVISLIIHTIFFVLAWLFTDFLFLTTVVSLEAIYLSILIQMSVNFQSKKLQSIQEDMEEIQEDVEEINEDEDENDIKKIKISMHMMQGMLKQLIKEVSDLKKKQLK